MSEERLYVYIIYDNTTSDYPGQYVARRQVINQKGEIRFDPTFFMIDRHLPPLREEMNRRGLFPLAPHPTDDPVILETWL